MVFRHKGRTDVPPLFEIERFTATSSLPSLLFRRVSLLNLEGLRVTVARDRHEKSGEKEGDEEDGEKDADGSDEPAESHETNDIARSDAVEQEKAIPQTEADGGNTDREGSDRDGDGSDTDKDDGGWSAESFVVSTIVADGTHLEVLPKDSERREKAVDTRYAPLGARRRTWTVR